MNVDQSCSCAPSFSFLTRFFCAFTVDDIYPLDFENPEGNGHGIFAFKVDNIRSADHSFLYDKVKIMLTNGVTDLSDVSRIKGTIVLGGRGFHLSLPSVPEYLTEDFESLFDVEHIRCTKTEDQYMIHMNRIANDQDRKSHTFLFLLPEDMAFTDNFANANASPSASDISQVVEMREFTVVKDIGGCTVQQVFFPGSFEMRLLHCNTASMALKSTSKADTPLNAFFSGMKVSHTARTPTPMKATRTSKKNGMQGEHVDEGDHDSML